MGCNWLVVIVKYSKEYRKKWTPVLSFHLDINRNSKDIKDSIPKKDRLYFEEFLSHAILFSSTRWVLNRNKTLFNIRNLEREKIFTKAIFQRRKNYDKECVIYSALCESKTIDFGAIRLPLIYLWENRGQRIFTPDFYNVNLGENLKLNLSKKNITFT